MAEDHEGCVSTCYGQKMGWKARVGRQGYQAIVHRCRRRRVAPARGWRQGGARVNSEKERFHGREERKSRRRRQFRSKDLGEGEWEVGTGHGGSIRDREVDGG